jgi:hypothetical protein
VKSAREGFLYSGLKPKLNNECATRGASDLTAQPGEIGLFFVEQFLQNRSLLALGFVFYKLFISFDIEPRDVFHDGNPDRCMGLAGSEWFRDHTPLCRDLLQIAQELSSPA